MGFVDSAISSLDLGTAIKSVGAVALVYGAVRVIAFLVSYRKTFLYFNSCQGVKDFSWKYGNLHVYPQNFEKCCFVEMEWMRKFPKYHRLWVGPLNPTIKVYHPDTIRKIIKSSEPKPRGHGGTYEYVIPWLGESLLIADRKRWARSRRLLTPAFHFDILKPYVDVINQVVDTLMKKIDEHTEDGTSFELFDMISLCSFDILLRCAMSIEEDFQTKGGSHPYIKAVNEIMPAIVDRFFTPIHHFEFIYFKTEKGKRFLKNCNYVHKYAEEIIEKRRNALEEDRPKSRYLDFLDILLTARDDEGKTLSLLEIRNEVDTFLFAGHDTTTSGISWTLLTMATRPEVQAKIQEELDGMLGERQSKHIGWDDINKLEYMSRCLKESMRFHSPVPSISRRLQTEMDIDGKTFPAGTLVNIAIWNLHHNPDVWEDPDVYDPDRFLPENIQKKPQYAYIPFSAGPRNCIGQHFALNEQKVIIGRVLERFDLTADSTHPVGRRAVTVMKSTEGLWVFAKRRHP